VQFADAGREREPGAGPQMTELEGAIGHDVLARPLHVHLSDVTDWAPEYREAREQVLDAAGVSRSEPRYG
jgi:hypothetical protein